MPSYSDVLQLTYPPIYLDRLRLRIAAALVTTIWFFLCVSLFCAAFSLLALAAGVTNAIDADLINRALPALLGATDALPFDRHPFRPLA